MITTKLIIEIKHPCPEEFGTQAITIKRISSTLWMCRQQQDLSKIKNGIPVLNLGYSALVDPQGFEPWSK
jgi:hypothetical protein